MTQATVGEGVNYISDENWNKTQLFNLSSDYLDAPIKIGLQSGLAVFSFGGRLLKDVGLNDTTIANTKSLDGFPLPPANMRGLFMDITSPESDGGVMGVLAWYTDGRIVMNLNKAYKASTNHYFNASLTGVTKAVPTNK